jgi:hypothetical protein
VIRRLDPEWLLAHARYSAFAAEWSRRSRPSFLLLHGGAIKDARTWLAERGSEHRQPTELEQAYIGASARFSRLWRTGLAVALAAVGPLTGGALYINDLNNREAAARVGRPVGIIAQRGYVDPSGFGADSA